MRAVWLTDIHLVFLRDKSTKVFDPEYDQFLAGVRAAEPDAVFITGDIGEAPETAFFLQSLAEAWQRPIYFVLGNHDFYFGSVASVRQQIELLCRGNAHLHYLSARGPITLLPGVALVGHDGWGDGRYGLYHWSDMILNDFRYVADLAFDGPDAADQRLPVLQALGDAAADHIRRELPAALDENRHVILLTHVPPFAECAIYRHRKMDEQSLPFWACKAMGDAILEIMASRPDRCLTVLCGHTHEACDFAPVPNVRVLVGEAEYGEPCIQRVFDLQDFDS